MTRYGLVTQTEFLTILFFNCLLRTALGASAVGIGKPIFFALGVGGEGAVSHLLHLLQTELESAMAICGIEKIEDANRSHVTRHPASTNHRAALFSGGTKMDHRFQSFL